ncbi:MAG: hypothetical protein AAGD96_03615 [Chloroflexota bacterium]
MEEQEEPIYKTTGLVAFSTALPLLLFTIVTAIIIGIIALQRVRQVGSTATLFDAAYAVCSGIPMAEATLYDPSEPGIHPVVAFAERGGFLQGASNYSKPEWAPDDSDDLELVLCTQNPRPAFRPLCNDDSKVNQIGGELPFTLRSAASGEEIAKGVIVEEALARSECLDELPQDPSMETTISNETIQNFLESFVVK